MTQESGLGTRDSSVFNSDLWPVHRLHSINLSKTQQNRKKTMKLPAVSRQTNKEDVEPSCCSSSEKHLNPHSRSDIKAPLLVLTELLWETFSLCSELLSHRLPSVWRSAPLELSVGSGLAATSLVMSQTMPLVSSSLHHIHTQHWGINTVSHKPSWRDRITSVILVSCFNF